ncbi:hypothetical protein [Antarcticirhabdus aurantiaca]|uniref:Uncharacterized protein n=1 Tax=Antarcticirhabdus aurantiaca TaxID=2606717 RepID=A0ACD4NKZ5_9HYPH|nr:hypothetical protein [Antarcticirhabdus aurantiaca]WAJ27409.1 hypothetical protein OXU80_21565 [Jeongeuplla avenae]
MVREKIDAFADAISSMMSGKSFDSVVGDYRTIVQANIERLTPVDNVAPAIADVSGHDIEEGRS